MTKKKKIGLVILTIGIIYAGLFFIQSNSKPIIKYKLEYLTNRTIENKIVATGKVIPKDEVEIKPQIAGIIERILVDEGEYVNAGDLLVKIRVVPDEQTLNNAEGRVKNANIILENAEIEYNRNLKLFNKEIISEQEFNNIKLNFEQAKQNLANAQNDFQIIKLGSSEGSSVANTNVRATVSGTVLEVPVKEGDQVIQANTFNQGTTIATIADLNTMIFEGKVDESEVNKLKTNMALKINLAAIEGKEYSAKLNFIAPKGIEEAGAVQFKIEASVILDEDYFIRAGYSANASIITEKRENVNCIPEAIIQYDKKTKKSYVEVETKDQVFEKKYITLGLSDGIYAEVISGITKKDKIKVWNKTEPIKRGYQNDVDDK